VLNITLFNFEKNQYNSKIHVIVLVVRINQQIRLFIQSNKLPKLAVCENLGSENLRRKN